MIYSFQADSIYRAGYAHSRYTPSSPVKNRSGHALETNLILLTVNSVSFLSDLPQFSQKKIC